MSETNSTILSAGLARGLILAIAKALVDEPEAVQIEVVPDGEGAILRLQVAANDLGKVIGKQGRTARSIRTILAASSMKSQIRLLLDIQTRMTDNGKRQIATVLDREPLLQLGLD